jgi:hypothetical protein
MRSVQQAVDVPECVGIVLREGNLYWALAFSKKGTFFEVGTEHGGKHGRGVAEQVGRELDLDLFGADDEDYVAIWDELSQGGRFILLFSYFRLF